MVAPASGTVGAASACPIPRHELRAMFRKGFSRLSHLCFLVARRKLFPKSCQFCVCVVQRYLQTASAIQRTLNRVATPTTPTSRVAVADAGRVAT